MEIGSWILILAEQTQKWLSNWYSMLAVKSLVYGVAKSLVYGVKELELQEV